MITEKEFLEKEIEFGIGFHNPEFVELCKSTSLQIKNELPEIKTILDYGGGTGVYSKCLHDLEFEVSYFDLYKSHIDYVKTNAPEIKIVKKPITTDLMLFIEVSEHMTDEELNSLFEKIKPKYILFSSTSNKIEGFDEVWGHVNIKEQNEWIEFFEKKNYSFIKDLTLPTHWTKLFKRI